MDTSSREGRDDHAGEAIGSAGHYSTGKLTLEQARTLNAWRRELHRPRRRTYDTPDGRPPASSSDCVAAAVIDLLADTPPALDVARYAARIRIAQMNNQPLRFPGAQHVSFYLPAPAADQAETLLIDARHAHQATIDELRAEARHRIPGRYRATERAEFTLAELADRGLTPTAPRRLPMGTLARMAIDRWAATRTAPNVVAAAVEHSLIHHRQHHRARKDMGRQ